MDMVSQLNVANTEVNFYGSSQVSNSGQRPLEHALNNGWLQMPSQAMGSWAGRCPVSFVSPLPSTVLGIRVEQINQTIKPNIWIAWEEYKTKGF